MSPPSSLYDAVVSQVSEFEVPSLDGYAKEAEKILSANVEVVGSEQRLVMIVSLTFVGIAILGPAILSSLNWVVWVAFSLVLGACQLLYALYQLFRILIDLVIMSVFKSVNKILRVFSCKTSNREKAAKERQRRLSRVDSLKEFKESEGGRSRTQSRQNSEGDGEGDHGQGAAAVASSPGGAGGKAGNVGGGGSGMDLSKMVERYGGVFGEVDEELNEAQEMWRQSTKDFPQATILAKTTKRLADARTGNNLKDLQFLLSGLLKRNHLGIHEDALYEHTAVGTKVDIELFQAEIDACLETLLESEELPFEEKLSFFKKERRSLGRTALCLSGGGAITMYHMGVVKAFIEAELYQSIRVFSGTSGGAITAGMLATRTEAELLRDVIVDNVSTDFKRDGSQAAQDVRWFPKLIDQLVNFTRTRVLVDRAEFKRCCDYYYGTTTFAEAYAHTKKHVSISVSNSQLGCMYSGKRRVLLNHISSPHVTVASAVAASCSLPGIMLPNKLWAKDADGNIVPFEVDGVEFIDGSILADLPFKRMSTLFNVSNFVVSQVNFHVTPFLHKLHSPKKDTRYWKILSFLDHDIRSRAQALSQLGLLPTFFGQTISGVAKQKYHGDVTIVPSFTSAETMGIKAVFNPDVKDMRHYIAGRYVCLYLLGANQSYSMTHKETNPPTVQTQP
mmetsp:Transcript_83748/g.236540  ORF Transcript_83748/g.236540 Transcript_83748/m.236540 type:complete len:675 (-) Transcript_83748:73-2097(-)